jgi:hypothetical protein
VTEQDPTRGAHPSDPAEGPPSADDANSPERQRASLDVENETGNGGHQDSDDIAEAASVDPTRQEADEYRERIENGSPHGSGVQDSG